MLHRPDGIPGSTDACDRGTRVLPTGWWSIGKSKKCNSHALRVRSRIDFCMPSLPKVSAKVTTTPTSEITIEESTIPASTASSASTELRAPPASCNKANDTILQRKTESGLVFAIIDHQDAMPGYTYRVQWCDEPDGFRWDDTWEPGSST
ncbi:hypothetical protein PHYPSEUDO_011947 [Phytophthora pseudosyringae]|uniref:Uncharacterized protein n=1 Tax=Phytophthora pseudosyringae TaxID=221518 RepID=A0A8T1V7J6_9STRA|nr:hypothetical protein PHYPSEUDO_011947 [Phytophthora pseudosyringae]